MRNISFFISILLLILSVLTLSQGASAQGNLARVRQGATTKEVQAFMGDPIDRIEREIKREQLWIYSSGSVVFIKGKAASVYLAGESDDILSLKYQDTIAAAKPPVPAAPASPVENIISEILREVPSEGGEAGQGVPALAPGEVRPVDIAQ
jgi:hypothetical protein